MRDKPLVRFHSTVHAWYVWCAPCWNACAKSTPWERQQPGNVCRQASKVARVLFFDPGKAADFARTHLALHHTTFHVYLPLKEL